MLGVCLKWREIFTLMFTAAPVTVVRSWKPPECPRRMMDKLVQSAHTVDCHSALETTDILTEAATWMDLEDTVPSEISSHKGTNTV